MPTVKTRAKTKPKTRAKTRTKAGAEVPVVHKKALAKKAEAFEELRPFRELREEMERFWSRPWLSWPKAFWRGQTLPLFGGLAPETDVYREKGMLVVKADMPGLTKADVKVTVEDGSLVVSGERQHEETKEERDYYRSERAYGSFYRRVPLPEGTDADKIKATCRDGVLEVKVPLPKGATKPTKQIEIA